MVSIADRPRGSPTPRPLVSVCIPAFNAATTIERTIRSVCDQGIDDLEIVVSDNASTDGTAELVEGLGVAGLRVVRQPRNVGMVRNYEAVIAASRGEFVKLLCADDTIYKGSLQCELEAIRRRCSSVVMVVAQRDLLVRGRAMMPRWLSTSRRHGFESGLSVQRRLITSGRNLIGEGQAVLVRGAVMRSAASHGLGDPYVVDLSLWLHVLREGDVHWLRHFHGAFSVRRRSESGRLTRVQRIQTQACLHAKAEELGLSLGLRLVSKCRVIVYVTLRRFLLAIS